MAMDYARRRAIAGNGLPFISFATLRGSVRRRDPDTVSTDPYFPTAGGTLTVVLDGDPETKTFNIVVPANVTMQAALVAINVLLGASPAKGAAYDSGGVIHIQTLTKGSAGSVEVTGGTAAADLGFDVTRGPQLSVGGDLDTAPEGKVGNPSTASFPVKGENLKTDSFVRALARLATNADVLYSEHVREEPRLKRLGTASAASQVSLSSSSSRVALPGPAGTRVYTGFGLLGASSSPEDLAPFFAVIDNATKRVAQSRVVAVVRGAVAGDPPYGNALDLSSAGNVLGQSFVRVGPLTIDSIKDGRFVYRAAGGMNVVKVGDIASIDGADGSVSVSPWDNRGLRWAVDWVSDTGQTVSLRPLSSSELALLGISVKDNQPIVELNDELTAGQGYGSVTFYTGGYLESISVVLQPPMPPGSTYEFWACTPFSLRSASGFETAQQANPLYRHLIDNSDPLPNAILTRPTLATVGGLLRVGQFQARLHGRVVNIPQGDLAGSGVAIWDEVDGLPKIVASVTAATQHIIATAVTSSTFIAATRVEALQIRTCTIGAQGQFEDLASALAHAGADAAVESLEFVLLENVTAPTGGWSIPVSGLRVRGISSSIVIAHGASGPLFTVIGTNSFVLQDVVVDLTKTIVSGTSPNIRVQNLTHSGGGARRSLDSQNENVDIGDEAPGVDIGKNGATTRIRGNLEVDGVVGDLEVGGTFTFGTGYGADLHLTSSISCVGHILLTETVNPPDPGHSVYFNFTGDSNGHYLSQTGNFYGDAAHGTGFRWYGGYQSGETVADFDFMIVHSRSGKPVFRVYDGYASHNLNLLSLDGDGNLSIRGQITSKSATGTGWDQLVATTDYVSGAMTGLGIGTNSSSASSGATTIGGSLTDQVVAPSITTHGRPVLLVMQSDGLGDAFGATVLLPEAQVTFLFLRSDNGGGSWIEIGRYCANAVSLSPADYRFANLTQIDLSVSAGPHIYKVQAKVAASSANLSYVRLAVVEL